MADRVAAIAGLPVPLRMKLRLLRMAAPWSGRRGFLVRWAANHPEIATADRWCARAWWGAAAGEVVRDHLYDPHRRPAALRLVERADVAAVHDAWREGRGLIVLTGHVGPPKFLMNWLIEQRFPLVVWTNTRDLPAWQATATDTTFLDPRLPDQKSVLLVKSAIHLRRGGVLLGAADYATGDRVVTMNRFGMPWRFSLGLPALARRLGVPVVVALALWNGNRIEVCSGRLEPPDPGLGEEAWNQAWLERYWAVIEPVLLSSPENLRFLRRAVEQIARPWEQAPR